MSIPILLDALLVLCLAMTVAWGVRLATGRSGWIDAAWSAAVGAAGSLTALAATDGGRGLLVAGLVALWSGRLALHIVQRTRGAADDPRYAALARVWARTFALRLFLFLQVQALAGFVLVVAVYLATSNPAPFPNVVDGVATLLVLGAVLGEAIADAQLVRFRRTAAPGAICDVGLWAWSRHPNYFFEWLAWVGFALFALSAPASHPIGFVALAAPVLMWVLLVHVSGIPPLEAHLQASRGEAFRAYAARVSPFVPRPPRTPAPPAAPQEESR
jgi:steroid 5-alpha reductase family enzyme